MHRQLVYFSQQSWRFIPAGYLSLCWFIITGDGRKAYAMAPEQSSDGKPTAKCPLSARMAPCKALVPPSLPTR
jgi:hypothetical protein